MIYICVPTHNDAKTVGLLLWKVRQVLAEFPREYQLLVVNDGSDDAPGELLERYAKVVPMSVTPYHTSRGHAPPGGATAKGPRCGDPVTGQGDRNDQGQCPECGRHTTLAQLGLDSADDLAPPPAQDM